MAGANSTINDLPEEVLCNILNKIDLKDLTNICVKVSKKWMNIIAFMIIHPILKTRNRGLAQKFEENGWSCDDANFILALLENQEKLSKVHDQMMMKASGFDWAMMVLSSRRSDRQRQCLAKREIFFHRIDSDIVDQIVSFLCDEEPEDKKDIAKNNLKMVLSSRKADSQRQCFVKGEKYSWKIDSVTMEQIVSFLCGEEA